MDTVVFDSKTLEAITQLHLKTSSAGFEPSQNKEPMPIYLHSSSLPSPTLNCAFRWTQRIDGLYPLRSYFW
jgi:hypothetical protein